MRFAAAIAAAALAGASASAFAQWGAGPVQPGMGMVTDASNAMLPNAFDNTALVAGSPLPDITQRMPGQGSDDAHGYAACSNGSYATCFWRYHGRVYQQGNAETGTPQWAVQNAGGSPLPANATSASAYGAWSCGYLLNSGYAGNSGAVCQYTRASDSTTLALGPLDIAANLQQYQTFCSGTTCGVSIAYDQVGSNNCTQATQAQMPIIVVDADGAIWTEAPNSQGTVFASNAVELSCSGVSLTENALSVAAVARQRGGSPGPAGQNIVNIGNSYELINWVEGGVTVFHDGGYGSGVFSGQLNVRGSVVIGVSGSSAHTVATDGYAPYSKSAFGATALSGMTLGMSPTGAPMGEQLHGNPATQAVILWSSALSNTDQEAARLALYALLPNLVPQARCIVAFSGESVLENFYQDAGQGILDHLREELPTNAVLVNQAWYAQTDAQMVSNYTDEVSWVYQAQNPCNILVMNPALNGIANGESVATVESNIASFIAAAQATGWKIGIMTEISRGGSNSGGTYDAQGQAITAWIRANVPAVGALVIDVAADPLLSATGAYSNTAIFRSDDTHLTDAGAAEEAGIIAGALIGSHWLRY